MTYSAAPKPGSPIQREEIRRYIRSTAGGLGVGAALGTILAITLALGEDTGGIEAAVFGVAVASYGGMLGAMIGGWRLVASENDFAGRDRPIVRRVRRAVFRGGSESLDDRESQLAAGFAAAFPTIAIARTVAFGWLYLGLLANQVASLVRDPGQPLPTVLIGLLLAVTAAAVVATLVQIGRARRYAAAHPLTES